VLTLCDLHTVAQIQTKSRFWSASFGQDMKSECASVSSERYYLWRFIRRVMRFNKTFMQQFLCKYQDVEINFFQLSSKHQILTRIKNKQKKNLKKNRGKIFSLPKKKKSKKIQIFTRTQTQSFTMCKKNLHGLNHRIKIRKAK
jgi:hypothetical protein